MLVLSRKSDETIHIGNDVVITIVQVKGRTVKVGIEAPLEIRIRRGEHVQNDIQLGTGGTEKHVVQSNDPNTSVDA